MNSTLHVRRFVLFCVIVLSACSANAYASYTMTVTSSPTTYVPGTYNTFKLAVTVTSNGTSEFVDEIGFTVPSGVQLISAAGPSPYSICGGGKGSYTVTSTTATWSTPGHPSGCGAFGTGTYNFYLTVLMPVGSTAPIGIVATTLGDGFPSPFTDFQTSTQALIFSASSCLDLDGNGKFDALTDGLMLIRAMFGLTGTAVTNGAIVGPSVPRPTWAAIRTYLNSNCGTSFAP